MEREKRLPAREDLDENWASFGGQLNKKFRLKL